MTENTATTARETVTEGTGNTVHYAVRMTEYTEDGSARTGRIFGTDCNREEFTTRNKRRFFYPTSHEVTCKRCIRLND